MNNVFIQRQQIIRVKPFLEWKLWFGWVFAGLVGETICLGAMGIAGAVFSLILANDFNSSSAVIIAFLLIALGVFKGVVVGFAQGEVLRKILPDLTLRNWIAVTVIGTVAAFILAAFPNFTALLNDRHAETTKFSVNVTTAVMGFGLGMILGFAQWAVLRRYVKNAGLWIFANGLAWAAGLPLLFSGHEVIQAEFAGWEIVFYIFAPIISAAAVVGAVQGLFLVWLSKSKERAN